jgi:DNA-binding CsgD family transcriptional regulator
VTAPPLPAPLVGRERELAVLRAHLDAAIEGHASLVLVSGEAGIGKTALAEAACREAAERGTLVLIGRCYDLTETPPYGPFVEAFARYPAGDGLPPLPNAFAERGTVGVVASQDALFRQVRDFFIALAAVQPVVLLLDDLHWADPASLDLLRFLARNLATLPLLLIATYRSDELTRRHPLYQILPLLVREAGAERLPVDALEDGAVRALVAERYPLPDGDADRLISYLQGRAEGNALFVGELLRALEEGDTLTRDGDSWRLGDLTDTAVPELLRQVIDSRVGRLERETQRLLSVGAVIGQGVPLAVWAAVAGVDEETLLKAVEQAAQAGLLAEMPDGKTVRFAHALIRETIYEGEMATRRRRLHRRVGEALAAMPHPDPDGVAYHFQQSGDDRAVEWLMEAGQRAQVAYAWATAATRYEGALALMERRGDPAAERGWLLYAISRLRRYADPPGSLRAMEEVLSFAREAGDLALIAIARFEQGLVLNFVGRRQEGVLGLGDGADALDALAPTDFARVAARTDRAEPLLRAARGTWMMHMALVGHLAGVLAYAERWATMDEPPHVAAYQGSAYADGWVGLGIAWAMQGEVERAGGAFRRALETYRAIGHHVLVGASAFNVVRFLALPYRADRPAEDARWVEMAADALRRAEPAMGAGTAEALPAPLDLLHGRWDAPSFARLEVLGLARPDLPSLALSARLARECGERERAWERVRVLLPDGAATEPGDCDLREGLEIQEVAVALSLDAGDMARTKEWLDAHDRWLSWSGAVLGRCEAQMLWARYDRQAGETAKAREHAERALAHAGNPRQPLALLAAHRLLGELDTGAGRHEDAGRHLDASLGLADACEAPYERALTLLAQAELRAAQGDGDAARALLDEMRAICEPLGAKPALARAAALQARFTTAPIAVPSYPAGLSAREVEVLRLVAQGLTNPQVAERLFLSPRTVEQHLRSIYNKLAVSTRAAATRFAVTHGLA